MNFGYSIIVVNYGKYDLLMNFLNSVEKNIDKRERFEVIVVDNNLPNNKKTGSHIDTSKFNFKLKIVKNNVNSYSSAINLGVKCANYDIIIASNSDIEILPQFAFAPITRIFEQDSQIGVIGLQLLYPNGMWQRSYGFVPSLKEGMIYLLLIDALAHAFYKLLNKNGISFSKMKKVGYVDGAFMIIRRKCFDECGGFDEQFKFYGEDADFCFRAYKTKWKVFFLPQICVLHLHGASSIKRSFIKYRALQYKAKVNFVKKHFGEKYAHLYYSLMKLVTLERVLFYQILSTIFPLSEFLQHFKESKNSYQAIKISKIITYQY